MRVDFSRIPDAIHRPTNEIWIILCVRVPGDARVRRYAVRCVREILSLIWGAVERVWCDDDDSTFGTKNYISRDEHALSTLNSTHAIRSRFAKRK